MPLMLRLLPALCGLLVIAPMNASAAQRLSQTGSCSARLVLNLRANPDPGRPTSAPAIPPGVLQVRVPLFPGAQPSSRAMPQASYGFPSSWYRKDARAEYLVPGEWGGIQQWYRAAFTSCGFRFDGSGYSGNGSGIVAHSVSFGFGQQGRDQITLTFEPAGAHQTLVLYAASAITLPPPRILVPGSPTGATISYFGSRAPGKAPRAVVPIDSRVVILHLVRTLNHLPAADEPGFCALDVGTHDTISFRYASGRTLSLDVSTGGCANVERGTVVAAHSTPTLLRLLAQIERG